MSNVKETVEAVQGIVEAVPVYEDMLQPAAKELGKSIHTLSKAINIALSPVSGLVWGFDQIKEYLQPALEKRFKNKTKENIVSPEVTVAGPALEALRFSGHNEELRELFANLLATSMDKESSSKAHPSFVEILKQLTSDEARLLKKIGLGYHPIISLKAMESDNLSYYELLRNFTLLGEEANIDHPEILSNYLDNLKRLGLIRIENVTLKQSYQMLKEHPFVISASSKAPTFGKLRYDCGYVTSSSFGSQFYEACIKEQ
ncbi:DUF4393 domain-containing protein [Bacillus sp. FJAT-29814]|uniref:DUF4393 domain-containing protein n=1 Tax=Bacillus sp. FJAT-29814 TaxID=1729688 RepID=UPI000833E81C|nr:DUF4393 domain-containing protein [Bacillus sp. FJAT-29814]